MEASKKEYLSILAAERGFSRGKGVVAGAGMGNSCWRKALKLSFTPRSFGL
jgi:hypothetical protein